MSFKVLYHNNDINKSHNNLNEVASLWYVFGFS